MLLADELFSESLCSSPSAEAVEDSEAVVALGIPLLFDIFGIGAQIQSIPGTAIISILLHFYFYDLGDLIFLLKNSLNFQIFSEICQKNKPNIKPTKCDA